MEQHPGLAEGFEICPRCDRRLSVTFFPETPGSDDSKDMEDPYEADLIVDETRRRRLKEQQLSRHLRCMCSCGFTAEGARAHVHSAFVREHRLRVTKGQGRTLVKARINKPYLVKLVVVLAVVLIVLFFLIIRLLPYLAPGM